MTDNASQTVFLWSSVDERHDPSRWIYVAYRHRDRASSTITLTKGESIPSVRQAVSGGYADAYAWCYVEIPVAPRRDVFP